MEDSAALLGAQGPFVRTLEGFAPRAAQQQMAAAIESALHDQQTLVAESGTGTGKTLAYLVPSVLSGLRVIISTGTRHLQDQIFHRDLPVVREALARPVRTAVLKGRSNYLCLHRLAGTMVAAAGLAPSVSEALVEIARWAAKTSSGDIEQLSGVEADSPVWPLVTSTVDNCLGARCPDYDACFVNRARSSALAADIIVVNHHLFCADIALREEGFAQLLPGADAVIFDEAHQLAEIAAIQMATTVSGAQLLDLARDAVAEEAQARSGVALHETAAALQAATLDLAALLAGRPPRGALEELASTEFHERIGSLASQLAQLGERLAVAAPAAPGLERCASRGAALLDALEALTGRERDDQVRWYELSGRSFRFHSTPVDIGSMFWERLVEPPRALVFTSATLTVGEDFGHFERLLGIEGAQTARWQSPFDFRRQSLLYLPEGMPDPREPGFVEAVVAEALPVLAASGGRAFLLFTSHQALQAAARTLPASLGFPVLVQGSASRTRLLERFRELGNAVLLGTASFWEGVDVRGAALSCVIIAKLPFAAPGDPVLRARLAHLEAQGRDPFEELQLPDAVLALKQGVGRLIRDTDDRGVLVLCDPRLRTRSYGQRFLDSLPPMPSTQRIEDVQAFFAR